jgi:hypothetical protein
MTILELGAQPWWLSTLCQDLQVLACMFPFLFNFLLHPRTLIAAVQEIIVWMVRVELKCFPTLKRRDEWVQLYSKLIRFDNQAGKPQVPKDLGIAFRLFLEIQSNSTSVTTNGNYIKV